MLLRVGFFRGEDDVLEVAVEGVLVDDRSWIVVGIEDGQVVRVPDLAFSHFRILKVSPKKKKNTKKIKKKTVEPISG